jgi:hypothetical protein
MVQSKQMTFSNLLPGSEKVEVLLKLKPWILNYFLVVVIVIAISDS